MSNIHFSNPADHLDAASVYDSTQGKTQAEINAEAAQQVSGEDISSRFSFTASRRINWRNGEMQSNSSGYAKASGYVSVDGYDSILITQRFRTELTTVAGLAFYDAEQVFLPGCGVSEPIDSSLPSDTYKISRIPVPTGAAFVRTTWWGDSTEQAEEIDFSCIGETSTKFASLQDLENAMDELRGEFQTDDLPAYYFEDGYIDSRVSAILTEIGNESEKSDELSADNDVDVCHHGDQFFWFTDPHFYWGTKPDVYNGLNSAKLIKYIQNRTNIRKVFCGGDLVGGSTMTKATCLKNLKLVKQHLSGIWQDLYMILGNHEWNIFNANDTNGLTISQIYSLLVKDKEREFGAVSSQGDYWFDNTPQKIRYFCLGASFDGGIKDAQIHWFGSELLKVPSGYTVVVLSHVGLSITEGETYKPGFDHIVKLLDAAKDKGSYTYPKTVGTTYDFSTLNAEIACVICGHIHVDLDGTTDGGIPVISTTCDRCSTTTSTAEFNAARVKGTITEQAIDVFVIDTDEKTVKSFRIGGSFDDNNAPLVTPDRTFSYADEIGG